MRQSLKERRIKKQFPAPKPFFNFHCKKLLTFFLDTSVQSPSSMAHTTTASLDKLTFIEYVALEKGQDRFGRKVWSKNDSNYLDGKFEVFRRPGNTDFQLVQNLTMGEADFSQFLRLRKQLAIAAELFDREGNLSLVLSPPMSKDMDQQPKMAAR